MDFIALSIRRPVFAWILMSALIVFGAVLATRLGVSQLPDVDFPVLTISVNYEGASPEVVESELVDPIEQNLLQIEGIKQMRASVRQGGGSVSLDFDINRNIDVALQEVQAALSSLRLPPGVDAPVIRKQNPEEQPIMFLSVYSDKPLREVITYTEDSILDQFRFIQDIGEVTVGGFSTRNLRIWPNVDKLRKFDLTVLDLVDSVTTQHVDTAAGQFSDGKTERRVRWLGEATSPEELGNVRILKRAGGAIHDAVIHLSDIADVEDGLSDIRRLARVNGKEAVSVMVRKMRGGNEVEIAKAVYKKIEEIKPRLTEKGYDIRVNIDFTRPTEAVVHTTYEKLWVAALVTIVICFLFLGSFQAALNILFSIPTSIVGTFIIIYFAGFTLNLFSLLALTLAISIVVDDAIMLLENIVRHHRMGKSPARAAYDGAIEILPAATAATLAVVAVFLPVIFMDGVTGKFFFQFGVTMSAAVLLSLVEAVTITPMRAAAFLSTSKGPSKLEMKLDHLFDGIAERYRSLLASSLKYSKTIVLTSVLLFTASVMIVKVLKQEFVPSQDQDILFITGQTKAGSSLEYTEAQSRLAEKILSEDPDVERFFIAVGAGGPNSEVNQISMPTYLKPREQRKLTHLEIMERIRGKFKEIKTARFSVRDLSSRGLTSGRQFPVSFNISGPDLGILQKKSAEIIDQLNKEGLTQDLDTDFKMGLPELLVKPDREKMAEYSVSVDAVARTLNATVAGTRISRFTGDGRRYDVRIKLREHELRSAQDIGKISVRNQFGNEVALSKIVTFEPIETYQAINRLNRQRSIGIYGNLGKDLSQQAVLSRAREIAEKTLPEGYRFALEGAAAGLAESFKSLLVALALGILVAYMILAVQFNSFVHPIAVLIALPFSVTGAFLSLWMFNVSLNLFSFIGIIVLMGIAKKNSILLVEFTNHVRAEGELDLRTALLRACPVRLRPILMTSVATMAAALPLTLGNSIGQETRTPMGLTIIGGTLVSTVFTLFVVPAIYLLLSKLERNKPHEIQPHPGQA
ncbi:MAG: efflux RND transporter permease subunit [Bdellovibrionales bacterium]|nr:efflux RND transporter permease subunit [Bdellovibrionales bacterium]